MLTVRNRILKAIAERLRSVASPEGILRAPTGVSARWAGISLSGSYSGPYGTARRFSVTVSTNGSAEVTERVDGATDLPPSQFPASAAPLSVPLGDSGLSVEVSSLPSRAVSVEAYAGTAVASLQSVFSHVVPNGTMQYPCAVVFPIAEDKAKTVSDRYGNIELTVGIEFRVNKEASDMDAMEETLGDIHDALDREPRFCWPSFEQSQVLNYESMVTKVETFASDGKSDFVGGLITFLVQYRHSEFTTRSQRN